MASINLNYNFLAVFEEDVFKIVLQQMMSVNPRVGYISLSSSEFIRLFDVAYIRTNFD